VKLLDFIIIKLTICLSIGILVSFFFQISLVYTYYTITLLLVVLSISFIKAKRQFTKNIWFGLLAFLTTITIGILVENLHDQKNFINHYSQLEIKENKPYTITFRIRKVLKMNPYYDKYAIDIIKIDTKNLRGKLLLNIKKDTLKQLLNVDDILVTKTNFKTIKSPLNPNQFNYKTYLEKQYIYHQIYTQNHTLHKIRTKTITLSGFAAQLRNIINKKLELYNFSVDELSIINALLLGQRQDINEQIYNNYINAGAVHMLAVSGLHVGIILILLNYVLKPIETIKYGRLIKTIIIIGLLWSFAIIAGLSASVTRAVTMFSVVAIGINIKRPTNIYNTLAISMFFLLLFKPLFLFDVGFQLSYLAVLGIVSIQPLLYKIWKPRFKIIDKLWQVFTVSLAAQVGVLPISLFYFHQFPGLFMISNLVIIPLLGFILGFGIVVIALAIINILPEFIADTFGSIISYMNYFMNWIANQEQFIFKDISFGILYLFSFYILITSLVQLLKKVNAKRIKLVLIAIISIQIVFIYIIYETKNTNELIIFHKNRFTLIGYKTNNKITIYNDFDSLTNQKDKTIRNYTVANHIKYVNKDSLRSIYSINNKKLLIIDSLAVYNIKSFKPDYILLRHSPRVNLQRLIDSIHPKVIIADGSNYTSYIKRWEATCRKQKLPFHQTTKKGAFIIKF